MAIQVVRFQTDSGPQWGVHSDGKVAALSGDWPTTGRFLTEGGADAARTVDGFDLDIDALDLLSPVTQDADYICQGLNYASHLEELDVILKTPFTTFSSIRPLLVSVAQRMTWFDQHM